MKEMLKWLEEYKAAVVMKMGDNSPESTVQFFLSGEIAACEKMIEKIYSAEQGIDRFIKS